MFKEYFKELENSDCLENEDGFILYHEKDGVLYISHCYLRPEARGQKKHYPLVDKVVEKARERGMRFVVASANVESPTCAMSLRAQLNYGFVPYDAVNGDIWLKYEVMNG